MDDKQLKIACFATDLKNHSQCHWNIDFERMHCNKLVSRQSAATSDCNIEIDVCDFWSKGLPYKR